MVTQDWHQKLHNNTTPDDVAICEAYIKFLEGNGDNGAYWRHLTDNGITRERLESFDRAIKVHPHFKCRCTAQQAFAEHLGLYNQCIVHHLYDSSARKIVVAAYIPFAQQGQAN